MKKITRILIITLVSLLVLTGCSKSNISQVSDADKNIATIKEENLTKGDIYEFIKLKYGTTIITSTLIDMQLEQYVELTDEDMTAAKKTLEETKENFKDKFEEILEASGYKDEADYLERFILKNLKNQKMLAKYFDENYESIIETLSTMKVRTLKADNKAKAEEALEKLQAIEELDADGFVEVASEYVAEADKEKVVADAIIEHVYQGRDKDTYLNTKLVDAKPGLYNEVIAADGGFVVLFFEEVEKEADADAILASISSNEKLAEQINKAMYANYSQVGKFEIHDKQLFDQFKDNNPFLPSK